VQTKSVAIEEGRVFMVEDGPETGRALLFLHGWPQTSDTFKPVMAALADRFHVAAIDLPGIGRSAGRPGAADKRSLARAVAAVIGAAGLSRVTLVGHDVGGQIVYAFLRECPGVIERAVILDVAIPGVAPWSEVVRNPHIWHFALHAVASLPELLVYGRQGAYFDFFFEALAANPAAITPEARRAYAAAYGSRDSLSAGFDWYRAFAQDEKDNAAVAGQVVGTPVLYGRGDAESGDLDAYLEGLRAAGLANLEGRLIAHCGHFSADEQPEALAAMLRAFVGSH
jgi:pimeloyl-ACP methyl ester carboxylesterase